MHRETHEPGHTMPALPIGAASVRGCTSPAGFARDAGPAPPAGSRRRRLWELPTQAHEMLLATSFTPEVLRREVTRTLGQMHKARCRLSGRDVDVLYAAIHDLTTRNALAEALHKRLDERHALALRRWAPLHGAQALSAAWQAVRESDALPGELWALLTHPQGAELDAEALYDARFWVFRHARTHLAQATAEAKRLQRAAAAEQALHEVRARAAQQQQQAEAALRRLQEELAAASGEAARWRRSAQLQAQGPTEVHSAVHAAVRAAEPRTAAARPPRPAQAAEPVSAKPPSWPVRRLALAASAAERTAPVRASESAEAAQPLMSPSAQAARAVPIDGRQVLCVGGIRHAVARYRSRVERLGAHFEHHDGGIEDGITGLDGRLQRADVVICQAACINHEAYHRIKRHCERTGKPCLYLERPSLAHFDRALAAWTPAPHSTRGIT